MIGQSVGVFQERKLAFHRGSNSRVTRSIIRKNKNALHQKIVDVVFFKHGASYKFFVTACSH
jgi:hypothetical protein